MGLEGCKLQPGLERCYLLIRGGYWGWLCLRSRFYTEIECSYSKLAGYAADIIKWAVIYQVLQYTANNCFITFLAPADIHMFINGTPVPNHGYVLLEQIGEVDSETLVCVTNNTECCSNETVTGEWLFPNGSHIPHSSQGLGFYTSKSSQKVHLHRKHGSASGIYRCEIPDTSGVQQTLYAGIYSKSSGKFFISQDVYT